MRAKRAIISVYDKTGIVEFAKALSESGIEIISSGGTATLLSDSGIGVTKVSDITGFPQMMDGRVKTLHPKIHGAILADRSKQQHIREAEEQGIKLIDLVVVNLYPFEEVSLKNPAIDEAVENIDIGGPTLIRSAAKNFRHVAVVCKPEQYKEVLEQIRKNGTIDDKKREELAIEAFELISHYDVIIENYLRRAFGKKEEFPKKLNLSFDKIQDLRYGENPHQRAAFYRNKYYTDPSVSTSIVHQGKQLSYNNILDINSAFELVKEFDEPTAVIVKHNNPCGVASNTDIVEAYKTAKSVDPEAAFGSVIAVNREIDRRLAEEIISTFVEVVVASNYTKEALEIFKKKKNIRIVEIAEADKKRKPYTKYRSIVGGLLVQDADVADLDSTLKVVTKRKPTEKEIKALKYAWKICKYVKSNAIVYARENRAVGIGAGQMKRVDAAKLGAMIARDFNEKLEGCVMASDAFFPFRDGIDYAAKLGITAIIQPGGSMNDKDVISATDEHGIAMIFTGIRHFRH